MKTTIKILTCIGLLSSAMLLHAAPFTIGSMDGGNCAPFMCNLSDTSVGPSINYQEAYNSSAFQGASTITQLQYQYEPFSGQSVVLGGTYQFWMGYSAVGLGLSGSLSSNWMGSPTLVDSVTIPAGGVNYGTLLTFHLTTPFAYNPATADLLIEIDVTNQDNLANLSGNGYNWADYSSTDVARAFCDVSGCVTWPSTGGLVTTFYTPTPEPGTLLMFGSGLLGLAGVARRKFLR